MRKAEQRLWDTMKRHAQRRQVVLERVENVVADGMPDVVVLAPGGHVMWVELKAPHRPARPTTRLLGNEGLRPAQVNWHLRAAALEVRTYVLIRDDAGAVLLVPGWHAAEMNDWPFDKMQFYARAQTWDAIFNALT